MMSIAHIADAGLFGEMTMSDLISRQTMIDAMRRHRALFCKNRIEFIALPKDEKARVDEIDNCIADLVNAPSVEPERTAKVEYIAEVYRCEVVDHYLRGICGICGEYAYDHAKYCSDCGAKLDWSE